MVPCPPPPRIGTGALTSTKNTNESKKRQYGGKRTKKQKGNGKKKDKKKGAQSQNLPSFFL
jgi:hypothetical protein